MQDNDRRKLENRLMVMGLAGLDDRNLIPQMALLIRDHDFYLGMLNECPQEKRYEMYNALLPHLGFKPWPLDVYIAKLKEKAGNIASHAEPVTVGEKKYEIVPAEHASGCIVTMRCHVCKRTPADFFGRTPVTAVILARQEGWVRDKALNKEVCPQCPAERGKRRKCPTCSRRHYAPDCQAITEVEDLNEPRERQLVQLAN